MKYFKSRFLVRLNIVLGVILASLGFKSCDYPEPMYGPESDLFDKDSLAIKYGVPPVDLNDSTNNQNE